MPNYKKRSSPHQRWAWLLLGFFSVALAHTPVPKTGIQFIAKPKQIQVSTQFDIELSKAMQSALLHDIPLYFVWEIRLRQQRPWYWVLDKTHAKYSITRKLSYHRTSRTYHLTHLSNNSRQIFSTLQAATLALATLALNIPHRNSMAIDYGLVQFHLDKGKLPAPINTNVLFSRSWDFSSKWHQAPVKRHE